MDNDIRGQAETAEKISIAVSRRKAFAMAAKLGLGSAALAGGLGTGMAANPPEAAGGLPKKGYKFVFVNHVTTNEFFTPTIYGVQDACAFFGCSYQWTGSQNSVVSEMVNAMYTAFGLRLELARTAKKDLPVYYGVFDLAVHRIRSAPRADPKGTLMEVILADAPADLKDFEALVMRVAGRAERHLTPNGPEAP